jgi:hypothetical protein
MAGFGLDARSAPGCHEHLSRRRSWPPSDPAQIAVLAWQRAQSLATADHEHDTATDAIIVAVVTTSVSSSRSDSIASCA